MKKEEVKRIKISDCIIMTVVILNKAILSDDLNQLDRRCLGMV